MIAILVVDDHPVVRDGIVAIMEAQEDFRVVASASRIDEIATGVAPDVAVLDWELPATAGPTAIRALRERFARIGIAIFSAYGGSERLAAAFGAGARAYVLKGSSADELIAAVRTIASGGTYVGRGLSLPLSTDGDRPTAREIEVLQLLAQGLTNAQIAERLNVAERTVKFHVHSIFSRLGAARRTEAVAIARERGLL